MLIPQHPFSSGSSGFSTWVELHQRVKALVGHLVCPGCCCLTVPLSFQGSHPGIWTENHLSCPCQLLLEASHGRLLEPKIQSGPIKFGWFYI